MAYKNKARIGVIAMHVDDLLITAKPVDADKHLEDLKSKFKFRTWKEPLEYCGGQLVYTGKGIELNYTEYFKRVKPIPIPISSKDETPCIAREIRLFRGLNGTKQAAGKQQSEDTEG